MTTKKFNSWEGYHDVDHQVNPDSLVSHLDCITGLDSVKAYKQQTYALLDLKPGLTVLDAGCGAGDDVLAMAERLAGAGSVIGIDTSEVMIETAKSRAANSALPVDFRVDNIYQLSFPADTFDCCRADRVFHHLDSPKRALEELIRVTKPGGRIVIFDPDFDGSVISSTDKAMTRQVVREICDRFQNGRYGRQLYGLFKSTGLVDLIVLAKTFLLLDYALADRLLGIETAVTKLIQDRSVSEDDGRSWLDSLKDSSQQNTFVGMILGFTVAGTKPSSIPL